MTKFLLMCSLFLLLFTADVFAITTCEGKTVLGNFERIKLVNNNFILDAKLDTGAATSSLSAIDISSYQQNNQLWLRFVVVIPDTQQKITMAAPLIKYIQIKSRPEENSNQISVSRPVISLPICIGHQQQTILVSLTDRTEFNYPMLIGRDALQKFNALVDVSQQHSSSPECH